MNCCNCTPAHDLLPEGHQCEYCETCLEVDIKPMGIANAFLDDEPESETFAKQDAFTKRVQHAINRKDWTAASRLITTEIQAQRLDTWYDCQEMLNAVTDAGYLCYECFLKAKGVLSVDTACRALEEELFGKEYADEVRQRNCGENRV